jgi:predicted MFS family arabinose efflux permease
MGSQAAAANLGQAAGAAITGVLYARSTSFPFIVASVVLAAGALISHRQPVVKISSRVE